jgi:hypothetical protein
VRHESREHRERDVITATATGSARRRPSWSITVSGLPGSTSRAGWSASSPRDLIVSRSPASVPWRLFFEDPSAWPRVPESAGTTVGEIMTRAVISIARRCPESVAAILDRNHIRRLPSLMALVGLVSRRSIKALASAPAATRRRADARSSGHESGSPPSPDTRPGMSFTRTGVVSGLSRLGREVGSETMARSLPGARGVDSHRGPSGHPPTTARPERTGPAGRTPMAVMLRRATVRKCSETGKCSTPFSRSSTSRRTGSAGASRPVLDRDLVSGAWAGPAAHQLARLGVRLSTRPWSGRRRRETGRGPLVSSPLFRSGPLPAASVDSGVAARCPGHLWRCSAGTLRPSSALTSSSAARTAPAGHRLCRAAVRAQARPAASWWREPGDRVALMLRTEEAFFSVSSGRFAGAIPVPLYPPHEPTAFTVRPSPDGILRCEARPARHREPGSPRCCARGFQLTG